MKLLAFLLLSAFLAMAGCSSEAAPDTAYHCVDDGVTCDCQQGQVPAVSGTQSSACVPQPKDCCAFIEFTQGGPACMCLHDYTAQLAASCSDFEKSAYRNLTYHPRSTCP